MAQITTLSLRNRITVG